LTMKCDTCRELMMAYLKEELDDDDRNAVAVHLDQCVECRRELEGVRRVLSVVDAADEPGILALVSDIIERAIPQRASDIHFQPTADGMVVRFRIDGVLHDAMELPKQQQQPVVARIKLMADMDTMEQKVPQDGRISIEVSAKQYDLRVSCLPTVQGESIVIRILSPLQQLPGIEQIGLSEHNRQAFDRLLHSPCGILIVTGPTGCGKTTTLYAALGELNRRECSVFTVEDPVEIIIEGVSQVPVNRGVGMDFAAAMRHILRQDPDVIMCGELRDLPTAYLLTQAALTGHLVLNTLHTNDAVAVLRRLSDMGVERFLIAEALLGALAQRLVRKLCPDCREQRPPTPVECAWLQASGIEDIPEQVWGTVGCDNCRSTGYRGRTAVHEVFVMDDEVRQMLSEGVEMEHIQRQAARGVVSMHYDAAEKVVAGVTDVTEALRVLRHISARDG